MLPLARLAALLLLAAPLPAAGATVFEVYDKLAPFVARLGGSAAVEGVDFDDIATSSADEIVAFDADRYEAETGVVIRSLTDEGQYVSRTFGRPEAFRASSPPNAYAPGPIAAVPGSNTTTVVTFSVGGSPGVVAGFGCTFIDADFPALGPSSFAVFDGDDALLAESGLVSGPNRSKIFRGIVAIDDAKDVPVPAIASVRIVSGNEWPFVNVAEGVVLDDFTFSTVPEAPGPGLLAVAAAALALRGASSRPRRTGPGAA
jgi:hypothetical protein